MRLLVLGGTHFLGRAIVDDACSRGYDVTTFSRGLSRPSPAGCRGTDRRPDQSRATCGSSRSGEWDAVIDTSVLAPAHVAASAADPGRPAAALHLHLHLLGVRRTTRGSRHRGLAGPRLSRPTPPAPWTGSGTASSRPAPSARSRRLPGPVPDRPARPDRRAARERPVDHLVAGTPRPGRDGARARRPGQAGPDDRRPGPGGLGGRQHPARPARRPSTCPGQEGTTFGALLTELRAAGQRRRQPARRTPLGGRPRPARRRGDPVDRAADVGAGHPRACPHLGRSLVTGRCAPACGTGRSATPCTTPGCWLKHEAATGQVLAPHGLLELGLDPDQERAVLAGLG